MSLNGENIMEMKDFITTEEIRKKFKSQFDLVTYAIRLAENMIKTGRDPRVKLDMQNRAMQILGEIAEGKDKFDDIPEEPVAVEKIEFVEMESLPKNHEGKKSAKNPKTTTSKKGRKILTEVK